MNAELVMRELRRYLPDEQYFKDYYEAVQRGESLEKLWASEGVSDYDKQIAKDPLSIDPQMTESKFFAEGRNVFLVKHPRYIPYFTHQHAFFEMLICLEGTCEQVIEGESIHMETGDLCLLAPNVKHGIKVFDDSIVMNLLIRHSTFEDIFLHAIRDRSQISLFFLGNLFEKSPVPYLLYKTYEDEELRDYILQMYEEQSLSDAYSDRIICSLVTIFFAQLTRCYGKNVTVGEQPRDRPSCSDAMLRFIWDHYDTVSLQTVAEQFHFSLPYCSKLIKNIAGCSFSDLVTKIRLQQGENLLSHTQISIMDISEMVGYKNPETFIRAFSRFYGMTPSQYRRSALPPQTRVEARKATADEASEKGEG